MVSWLQVIYILLLTFSVHSTEASNNEGLNKCPGECMTIEKCPYYEPFLYKRSYGPFLISQLRNNFCGYVDMTKKIRKICCPEYVVRPDLFKHKNFNLLPINQCGPTPIGSQILGGYYAMRKEFPWMALLGYGTGFKYKIRFNCAGTLINKSYVLTAAHCVFDLERQKLEFVRLGEYNIATERDCADGVFNVYKCEPPVQDLPIAYIIIHSKFKPAILINDIALIRLKNDANLEATNVKPICLPFGFFKHTLVFKFLTDQFLIITGWGKTEKGRQSSILKKASVKVHDPQDCIKIYGHDVNISIINQICAGGNEGTDSCVGDSGGPLQHSVTFAGTTKFIQEGIVSYGTTECGTIDAPAIYTNIAIYMKWILDNIKP